MPINWENTYAAVWRERKNQLHPVTEIDPISISTLVGVDRQVAELQENTKRLVTNLPANNALLWGARGTGKSSLVKAMLNEYKTKGLRLVEVYKNDLYSLPEIVDEIRNLDFKFIIYCDDFSFEENEHSYVALKTLLDGSIEPPPKNVLLYATSNRRHLMPEYMKDNLDTKLVNGELHYSDTVEEKISLSDRFGLWISFQSTNTNEYLDIIDSYFPNYKGDINELHEAAKQFAQKRSSKSGRTAKQFYNIYSNKKYK